MVEQINSITNINDFIRFVRALSLDYNQHCEQWENITIPDFLQQMASWVEDYSASPSNDIEWSRVDFQILAKMLYMGKLYE